MKHFSERYEIKCSLMKIYFYRIKLATFFLSLSLSHGLYTKLSITFTIISRLRRVEGSSTESRTPKAIDDPSGRIKRAELVIV